MNTTTLESSDGWPPLPSGPPPVPAPSLSSSRSFPQLPSTGSHSGTPPPPGDYDTPPPPGESKAKSDGPAQGGLAAWETAQKALAALNPTPAKTAFNNAGYDDEQDRSWQGPPPPGWYPPVPPPGGPMSRFPGPPPYGFPPRPPYGYPPGMPPAMPGMPPWGRPPMRPPRMAGAQSRQPAWGAPRQPNPPSSMNANSNIAATSSASGQPIRFNLQFQKNKPKQPTPPQSIPLPSKPNPALGANDMGKNPTPGMSEWPDSLRRYVTQCFSRCQTEIDKDQTEIILKGKLTRAFSDGSAFTVDWDNEQLPTLHSDKLKQQQQQQQQQPAPNTLGSLTANINQNSSGYDPMSLFRGRDKSGHPKKQQNKQQKKQQQQQQPLDRNKPMTVFSRVHNRDRSRSRSPQSDERNNKRTSRDRRSSHLGGSGSTGSGSASSDDDEPTRGGSARGGRFAGRGGNKRNNRDNDNDKSNKRHNNSDKKHKGKIGSAPEEEPTVKEARLAKRAERFQDHLNDSNSSSPPASFGKKNKRQKLGGVHSRLSLGGAGSAAKQQQNWNTLNNFALAMGGDEGEIDWSSFAIKGTSATVEKKYLRLTAAPDPSTVRPPSILRKALELAKRNWLEKSDYYATCDAFKSIRQDLTVQCIRDAFTVQVYETHARVAIEKRDKEEFNMCLTQLKLLHKDYPSQYVNEFAAYRLLYYIYTKNTLDIGVFIANLSPALKSDPCIKHALEVRKAWSAGNYRRFFRLYENAPNMASSLMDFFMERERKEAFVKVVKSYRPTVTVQQLRSFLAFEDDSRVREFLEQVIGDEIVYADAPTGKIDCKATSAAVAL